MDTRKIESGVQLFSRLNQRPLLENLYPELIESGPFPNEFIEIAGGLGVGKTTLLMDLMKRCLLPAEHSGKGCGVVLINGDHHFDMFRFVAMFDVDLQVVKSCLANLIVLNCYDSDQLQVTFYNLENILLTNPKIGFVAVDSISAQYWQYRSNKGVISSHGYHCKMMRAIEESVRNCNVVVAYTKQESGKEIRFQAGVHRIALHEDQGKSYAIVNKCEAGVPFVLNDRITFSV
ncbi:DNA repair protein XRCC2-like [Photinus pyralis]|nr:DNA repair protein XRCC2-like [Photinus pyralis]